MGRQTSVMIRALFLLASLAFACSSAWASTSSSVTFKGTVFMADGLIDPADVKIVLTEREQTKEVNTRSTYLQVPRKFYKTFAGDTVKMVASDTSKGNASLKPQGDFNFQFDEVPVGTHTLDIIVIGLVFPQVKYWHLLLLCIHSS